MKQSTRVARSELAQRAGVWARSGSLGVAVLSAALTPAGCASKAGAPAAASPPIAPLPPDAPTPEATAPRCTASAPGEFADCVQPQRIRDDLDAIVGMRPPGSLHHSRVRSHCAEVLERSGFSVSLHDFGGGVNVLGERAGTERPDERVMVGAHYDHIPGCAGADDNASGVAGLLEVARVLGPASTPRTLVVACWDREEDRLLGSRAYAAGPLRDAGRPLVYFNFDAIGFTDPRPGAQRVPTGFGLLFPLPVARLAEHGYRADFIALVTDQGALPWAQQFEQHAEVLGLPVALLAIPEVVKDSHLVIDLQRSDHASFWDAGVPAIMITDTADFRSDAYHCGTRPDTLDTLDLPFIDNVARASTFAVAAALGG